MLLRLLFAIGLGFLIASPAMADSAKPLISFVQDITPKKPALGHNGERRQRLKIDSNGLLKKFKKLSKQKSGSLEIKLSSTDIYNIYNIQTAENSVADSDIYTFQGMTSHDGFLLRR